MGTPSSGSVSSADGTMLAFDRYGDGSPVILIGGPYNDRSTVAGIADAISSGNVAAVTYDRRGRGASTNNDGEFKPERELEDLSAMIEALGGSVGVFGHSSGAVLALEAAMQRLPIDRLAVYEPSYMVDGTRPLPPDDLDERLCALVREGRRGEAVVLFCTEAVGLPPRCSARCTPHRHGVGSPLSRTRCPTTWLFITVTDCPAVVLPSSSYRSSRSTAVRRSRGFARPRTQSRRWFRGRGGSRSKVRTTASCSTRRHFGRHSSSSSTADHRARAYAVGRCLGQSRIATAGCFARATR